MTPAPITGLHHVSAITGDVQKNADFYTRALGLRLVKATINYDDPGTYHLYYGDGLGRPGTAMTFFGWPGRPAVSGNGHAAETAFTIPQNAVSYWQNRLVELAAADVQTSTRFGQTAVTLKDPDGLPIALIETPTLREEHLWAQGGVPAEYAIRGFHSVTLTASAETLPAEVLVNRFGWKETGREANRVRYEAPGDAAGRIVDVLVQEGGRARMGVGGVHHVAFRVPTDQDEGLYRGLLLTDGRNVSPIIDRDYFHSIYFNEPGGTLFEIATDQPGFTINETPETLGSKLMLPRWLESRRKDIEEALPALKLAGEPAVTTAAQ